jgi:hypothetical protein
MTWRILSDEPEDVSNFDKDASVWLWEIERGEERRYVEVTVTMPSLANAALPVDVRAARESKGRTAVEAYLRDDDPPRHVVVGTQGISV